MKYCYIEATFLFSAVMKRSRLLITVLLSLFVFQSTWNLAAAYCIHEATDELSISHFGHHLDYNNEVKSVDSSSKLTKYLSQISEAEHDDHLPTVAYIFQSSSEQLEPERVAQDVQTSFVDLKNLYQSPDLNLPKPPPSFTSL
ncbi:hypothetical protein B9T31_00890 [Acinetobacter sp. ANC 4558]|uniref:cation efflux protein, CzcI-like n=1 Tax=Acinetobacter sp. ANC 4558 TaxID=1977876 RepID=UPI000A33BD44|nr:cation efflux protein, CzcI-like [Acinetobacter sp. ANC 4558]OTG88112.1 hypothetical protein B9T31_00890 [Acinetobacter sp. ANC 4558]